MSYQILIEYNVVLNTFDISLRHLTARPHYFTVRNITESENYEQIIFVRALMYYLLAVGKK